MGPLDSDRAARRRQIQLTQDLIAPRASAARGFRRREPSRPEEAEQPLELILARNLVSIVSLAALLVDVEGRVVFYNSNGTPLAADELPLTVAVREGRPAFARLRVRGDRGLLDVEAGALPLLGPAGYHGAMVFFWSPASTPPGRADAGPALGRARLGSGAR
jgi:hypothetical protein